ncbi:MAG: hypothetical protein OQJ97_10890 [Rhodospirillales bacterium]|nr:hypothetical protein [Rhodospirillales bacterium]
MTKTIYKFGKERSKQRLSPRPLEGRIEKPVYDTIAEPPLAEVLADPIVHAVMKRDGVTMEELSGHINQAQHTLVVKNAGSYVERTAA